MFALRSARLGTGQLVDIYIDGRRIERIAGIPAGSAGSRLPSGPDDVELDGRLVLPLLVDGHAHLDKTFLGAPWQPHVVGGSVRERIEAEKRLRSDIETTASERAKLLAHRMIGFGVGYLRSHVDIDPETGLRGLEAMLTLREELRDVLDIQIAAFPQSGVLSRPGTAQLLAKSLDLGAEVIGGLDPADIDGDIDGQLGLIFELAEERGVDVEVHLHSTGATALTEYRSILEVTRRLGLRGRVTISHGFGLGQLEPPIRSEIFDQLAELQVSVMTNGPTGPMPPIRELVRHGVTVFAGTDNIRDAWSPFGSGDVLAMATRVAYQSNFHTDDDLALALDMVTYAPASVLRISNYGIAEGNAADLLVVGARSIAEAVADPPTERKAMRNGTWIFQSETTTWPRLKELDLTGGPARPELVRAPGRPAQG